MILRFMPVPSEGATRISCVARREGFEPPTLRFEA